VELARGKLIKSTPETEEWEVQRRKKVWMNYDMNQEVK